MDASQIEWVSRVADMKVMAADWQDQVRCYQDGLSFNPKDVDDLNERLATLQGIRRKYGSISEALLEKARLENQH